MRRAALPLALVLAGCSTSREGAPEAGAATPRSASLCHAHEEIIFSCSATNGPDVSVCGQPGQNRGSATLRIAAEGKAVEQLPQPGGPRGRYARVDDPGHSEAQIEFRGDNVRVVVFSRQRHSQFAPNTPSDGKVSDGLYVFNDAGLIGYAACDSGRVPIRYDRAARDLDRADDLFVRNLEAGD